MNSTTALVYLPVLHQGYLNFMDRHQLQRVMILASSVTSAFPELKKDIRAIDAAEMVQALKAVRPDLEVSVIEQEQLIDLDSPDVNLVASDDEVIKSLAQKYFPQAQMTYDQAFLRWTREKSLAEQNIETSFTISNEEFDQKMMDVAELEAQKSGDWWRQVGAAVVKNHQLIATSFNRHLPQDSQPYADGDPRANFHRGENLDKTTAIHAEAFVVAQAAKIGRSLQGADLYVSTFPCPTCAKLVAESGIKTLYFRDGYAMVDAQTILQHEGVEIIKVAAKE